MKTILASEIPGMLNEFSLDAESVKYIENSSRNKGDTMKEVNAFVYAWANDKGIKILSLFCFELGFNKGYDILINYE